MTDNETAGPTTVSRRSALRAMGVAGAVGAAGVTGLVKSLWPDPAHAASSDCVVTPEVTEGPYWVDTKLKRSDITSSSDDTHTQGGVPLELTIYLRDNNCGGVISGAWIDIWHANDQGVYSDESSEGTASQDWLRGYQVTDSDGKVVFKTVFPGWYNGRTIHIHVRVRTFNGDKTTNNYTTQLFFTEAVSGAVVATSDYTKSGSRTKNSADSIYQQEVNNGGAVIVPVSGNVNDGYAGTVIAQFMGDASSTDSTVAAKLLAVSAKRVSKRRRRVTVHFRAGAHLAAAAELKLGGEIVEKSRLAPFTKGKHEIHLPLHNSVGSGRGHVFLALLDTSDNQRVIKHPVTIPE